MLKKGVTASKVGWIYNNSFQKYLMRTNICDLWASPLA
jgi:hypothetical protein